MSEAESLSVTDFQILSQQLDILLNPMSDQHLNSPYSNAAELFIEIRRIKEMTINLRSCDGQINSPHQH